MWGCSCPGQNGCAWYQCPPHHPDDYLTLQVKAFIDSERLEITGFYASSPSLAPRSYSIDRLIDRSISGQCNKDSYELKFFQKPEDQLKFEAEFLSYGASEDNKIEVLARQTP